MHTSYTPQSMFTVYGNLGMFLRTYCVATVNPTMTHPLVLEYFKNNIDPLLVDPARSAGGCLPDSTTHNKQRPSSHVIRWLIPFGV